MAGDTSLSVWIVKAQRYSRYKASHRSHNNKLNSESNDDVIHGPHLRTLLHLLYLQLHTRQCVIQRREQRAITTRELTKNHESKGEEWPCASINDIEWIERFPYKLNFTFYQSIERGSSAHFIWMDKWEDQQIII